MNRKARLLALTALAGTLAPLAPTAAPRPVFRWPDPPPSPSGTCPWCKGPSIRHQTENHGHGHNLWRFFCAQHHSWLEGTLA